MHIPHLRPQRTGNRIELLIVGHNGNYIIIRLHQGHDHRVIGARSAVDQNHLIRLYSLVQTGHGFFAARSTVKPRITEIHRFQFLEEVLHTFPGKPEQLLYRHGLHTAAAQINFVLVTVTGRIQPVFQYKVINFHFIPP